MPEGENNNNNNNNNANVGTGRAPGRRPQNPLLNVRDRLFHALFYRIALAYARAFPKPIRRVIEFAILIKVCVTRRRCTVIFINTIFQNIPN